MGTVLRLVDQSEMTPQPLSKEIPDVLALFPPCPSIQNSFLDRPNHA